MDVFRHPCEISNFITYPYICCYHSFKLMPQIQAYFFRWDVLVICFTFVLKLAVTVSNGLFQTFCLNWLMFSFSHLKKIVGLCPKSDRQKKSSFRMQLLCTSLSMSQTDVVTFLGFNGGCFLLSECHHCSRHLMVCTFIPIKQPKKLKKQKNNTYGIQHGSKKNVTAMTKNIRPLPSNEKQPARKD